MYLTNILMLPRNLLISQSQVGSFLKFVKYAEHKSKQIIFLSRFISNSGLIAGCCFSRQSDEEAVIPKSNNSSMDNKSAYTFYPEPTIVQKVTNFFRMKRSCDSHDDLISHQNCVDTDHLIESCTKRQKTNDHENDATEGVDSEIILESSIRRTSKNDTTIEDVNSVISPSDEVLDVPKAEFVKCDRKKSKSNIQKPERQRPNYFVAIQISDAQIIKSLSELQQHLLEQDERLKKSIIQLATLHITLMVMYIGDTDTHARALKVLENIHQEHNDEFCENPLKLEFKGLSHFQNRVLYAKLSADDSFKRLSSLVESVRKHYADASIHSTDSRTQFTPHLTIAKIQFQKMKKNERVKKIDPSFYKDFNDQYFGSQEVQSIQLLSMTDPKDEDGYYAGNTIYFSTFEPKVIRDHLSKLLETEKQKEDIKKKIKALVNEKLK